MGADILLLDLTGLPSLRTIVIATADSDGSCRPSRRSPAQLKADESVRPLGWKAPPRGLGAAGLWQRGGAPVLAPPAEYYALEEFWEKGAP
jgi:hypothetical protein